MRSCTSTRRWKRAPILVVLSVAAPLLLAAGTAGAAPAPASVPDASKKPPKEFRPVLHVRADAERSGAFHFPPMRVTPHETWRAQPGPEILGSPLLSSDGVLYTGGSDGSIYAFDARTGTKLWSGGDFEVIESALALAGDVIIGGGQNKRVRALNRRDGSLVWSFDATAFVFTPPLIVGDVVYIATYDQLHALDLRTGTQRWAVDTGDQPAFVGAPAFAQGAIYVSVGPRLLAFDSATGKERWRVQAPTQFWSLAVGQKSVYVGNSDGYFHAYDLATGQEHWRFKSAFPAPDEIWSAPAVAGDAVYVGSRDQFVYAIDARAGSKVWAFKTAGDSAGDPVFSNGMIYVSDSNHLLPPGLRRLHSLDAETGAEAWRYEVQSTLLTNPAPERGALYVTITGQVIALE